MKVVSTMLYTFSGPSRVACPRHLDGHCVESAMAGHTLILRMNGSYAVLRKEQQKPYSASRASMALWLWRQRIDYRTGNKLEVVNVS